MQERAENATNCLQNKLIEWERRTFNYRTRVRTLFPTKNFNNAENLIFVEDMIRNGADLDVIEQRGITACLPCVFWSVEMVKFFVKSHGRNVNSRDRYGNTALIYAAAFSLTEVVRFLIHNGADPNIQNPAGESSIWASIFDISLPIPIYRPPKLNAAVEIARFLIDNGVDIAARNNEGLTLLHTHPSTKSIFDRILVEGFEKLNSIDVRDSKMQRTPLMVAAENGNFELCRLLAENGANVKARDVLNYTALHYAFKSSGYSRECVKFLRSFGAVDNSYSNAMISNSGLRPYELAFYRNPKLVESLMISDDDVDSNRKIDMFEMEGSLEVLKDNFAVGSELWREAFEIKTKTKANKIPSSNLSPEQRTTFGIEAECASIEEIEILFGESGDNIDTIYRHALVKIDRISRGFKWGMLNALSFLIFENVVRGGCRIYRICRGPYNMPLYREMLVKCCNISEEEEEKMAATFSPEKVDVIGRLLTFTPSSEDPHLLFIIGKLGLDLFKSWVEIFGKFCSPYYHLYADMTQKFLLMPRLSDNSDIRQLARSLVELDVRSATGGSMLHSACTQDDYKYADMLIDFGADVLAEDVWGQTPIQLLRLDDARPGSSILPPNDLVLKMVSRGSHLDLRNCRNPMGDTARTLLENAGINTLPYVTLKCLVARVLVKSFVHYEDKLPVALVKFVNMH